MLLVGGSALGAGVWLWARGSPIPPSVTRVDATAAASAKDRFEIPRFGQPAEARRFLDAATAGDRHAIELLDESLAEAAKVGNADPEYVTRMTEERSTRGARLAAYEAARRRLETAPHSFDRMDP